MIEQLGQELSRILLAEPLECGMTDCESLTTSALLEPDGQTRGLWRLLPLCATCSSLLQRSARHTHRHTHAEQRDLSYGDGSH